MTATAAPTSLRDLIFILFKWKWAAATIVLFTLLGSLFYLGFIRDPAYAVGAKILVKIGHEQGTPPTLLGGPAPIFSYRSHDVKSEVDILNNQVLIKKLVEHFDMHVKRELQVPDGFVPKIRYYVKKAKNAVQDFYGDILIRVGFREALDPKESIVFALSKGLEVTPIHNSNVIDVKMTLPFRVGSSVILNQYLDFYLDYRRKVFHDAGAGDFFAQQAEEAMAGLEAAEMDLADYEATHSISNIEKQKEVLLSQIADTRRAVDEGEVEMRETALKVEKLEEELASDDPAFGKLGSFEANSFSESLMRDLAELQREAQQLRLKEFAGGTRTTNNRQQFQVLLGVLASNLRAAHAERVHSLEERRRDLATLEAEVAALQASQRGWASRKRDVSVLEREYLFETKKLEEALALDGLERQKIGNVVVIQPAIDPLLPAGIRKARFLAMMLAAGGLGALFYVAIAEFFDHRFYDADTLEERLGAPVLAVISDAEAAPR